jgi:hypothetical protein
MGWETSILGRRRDAEEDSRSHTGCGLRRSQPATLRLLRRWAPRNDMPAVGRRNPGPSGPRGVPVRWVESLALWGHRRVGVRGTQVSVRDSAVNPSRRWPESGRLRMAGCAKQSQSREGQNGAKCHWPKGLWETWWIVEVRRTKPICADTSVSQVVGGAEVMTRTMDRPVVKNKANLAGESVLDLGAFGFGICFEFPPRGGAWRGF